MTKKITMVGKIYDQLTAYITGYDDYSNELIDPHAGELSLYTAVPGRSDCFHFVSCVYRDALLEKAARWLKHGITVTLVGRYVTVMNDYGESRCEFTVDHIKIHRSWENLKQYIEHTLFLKRYRARVEYEVLNQITP